MLMKNEIIIHCSATRPNWMRGKTGEQKVAAIRHWHVHDNGWSDIAYAEVIDRKGRRYKGRDLNNNGDVFDEIGAHTKGRNKHTIGVCLLGGFGSNENDKFEDHFTPEQEKALLEFIEEVRQRFGDVEISGHNEYAAKACPGFQVKDWLAGVHREPRTSLSESKTLQASQVAKVAATASPVVAMLSDMSWQNVLIIAAFSLVVLVATGIIDIERFKKWQRGDR